MTTTMTTSVALVITMVIAIAISTPIENESIIDSADIENMLIEKLQSYTDCFLDQGPCDEIAAKIRKIIPVSVESACANCTQIQKHAARRYFEELTRQTPQYLEALSKKYDPEFKYYYNFVAALKDA